MTPPPKKGGAECGSLVTKYAKGHPCGGRCDICTTRPSPKKLPANLAIVRTYKLKLIVLRYSLQVATACTIMSVRPTTKFKNHTTLNSGVRFPSTVRLTGSGRFDQLSQQNIGGGARNQREVFQVREDFVQRARVRARPRCESHKPTKRISGTVMDIGDTACYE